MTAKDLFEGKSIYKKHHTSLTRGYVRKNEEGIVEKYNGMFGKGYTVKWHNPNSTQYCYKTYFIMENN